VSKRNLREEMANAGRRASERLNRE